MSLLPPIIDPSPPDAPAPRLIAAERVAIGLVVGLVLAAFMARPLAERADPVLGAEVRAHYGGPLPLREDQLWLIPRAPERSRWWPGLQGRTVTPDVFMGQVVEDAWGRPFDLIPIFECGRLQTWCHSAGPDGTWSTQDDVKFILSKDSRCPHEQLACARTALLALAAGVALVALLARLLPRATTTGQDVGISLALSGAAFGALVPFTTGWVDSLPIEVKDAISSRLLVDARHAIVGSVVIVTVVGVLLLRLGRRAVEPPEPEPEPPVVEGEGESARWNSCST